jgi:hypothetical protein
MKKYTDLDVVNLVPKVFSMRELLRELGYKRAHCPTVKKIIIKLALDTSHWLGKAWNSSRKVNLSINRQRLSRHARKSFIESKHCSCESCGLKEWLGQPAAFEIHHIDENPENNLLCNLQLLCLQCHALTKNWRGKGKKYNLYIAD